MSSLKLIRRRSHARYPLAIRRASPAWSVRSHSSATASLSSGDRRAQKGTSAERPAIAEKISRELITEPFPRGLDRRFSITSDASLVPRTIDAQIFRDIVSPLACEAGDHERANLLKQRNVVVIDGDQGVGKSAVLLRAVEQARRSGTIALYIPSAREWTHGDGFFAATTVEDSDEAVPDPDNIAFYDRPSQTLPVLTGLIQAHEELLRDVACDAEAVSEMSDIGACQTAYDVVSRGIELLQDLDADWRQRPRQGCTALSATVRLLCRQTAFPFLIAIDQWNALAGLTSLVSTRRRCVHANAIRAVAEHFGRNAIGPTSASMHRGAVLLALSHSHGEHSWRPSRIRGTADYPITDDLRSDASGKEWMKYLQEFAGRTVEDLARPSDDPYEILPEWQLNPAAVSASRLAPRVRVVRVPRFSVPEMSTLLDDLTQLGILQELEPKDRKRVISMSGGRADILYGLCKAC